MADEEKNHSIHWTSFWRVYVIVGLVLVLFFMRQAYNQRQAQIEAAEAEAEARLSEQQTEYASLVNQYENFSERSPLYQRNQHLGERRQEVEEATRELMEAEQVIRRDLDREDETTPACAGKTIFNQVKSTFYEVCGKDFYS